MIPDFNLALQKHFDCIKNRDLEAFKSHLTQNKILFTIVQNGHAFTTPEEITTIHAAWFKDPKWIWEASVIHTVVGTDMAMAVIKYNYRAQESDTPIESWLTYVFALENGTWKIVHDQNTALDFPAFLKAMNSGAE